MGMQRTYEQWLSQANDGLHRMRCARADSMIEFSEKDPGGFRQLVDAIEGLHSTICPEVRQRWYEVRVDTLLSGKPPRSTSSAQSVKVSVP